MEKIKYVHKFLDTMMGKDLMVLNGTTNHYAIVSKKTGYVIISFENRNHVLYPLYVGEDTQLLVKRFFTEEFASYEIISSWFLTNFSLYINNAGSFMVKRN